MPAFLLFVKERLTAILGGRRANQPAPQREENLPARAEPEAAPKKQQEVIMVSLGLEQAISVDQHQAAWEKLTLRQKEVVALVCLGYSYDEIADYLVLSRDTIKTHIKNALRNFGYKDREDLMAGLAHWDFSAWGPMGKGKGKPARTQ